MRTQTDEIADGIFRFSTLIPDVTPDGFTFNQFLIRAEQLLLFHTGRRGLFPSLSAAVGPSFGRPRATAVAPYPESRSRERPPGPRSTPRSRPKGNDSRKGDCGAFPFA